MCDEVSSEDFHKGRFLLLLLNTPTMGVGKVLRYVVGEGGSAVSSGLLFPYHRTTYWRLRAGADASHNLATIYVLSSSFW